MTAVLFLLTCLHKSQFEEKKILGCCTLLFFLLGFLKVHFVQKVSCIPSSVFLVSPRIIYNPCDKRQKTRKEKIIVNKKRQNFYACFFHLRLVWSVGNINKKTLFCSMGFQRVKKTKSQVEWLFFKSKNKSYDYCTLFILRRDLIQTQYLYIAYICMYIYVYMRLWKKI